MIDLMALTEQCAPNVPKDIMAAVVLTESARNPYAIGVVKGAVKQPQSKAEAIRTVYELESQGKNFSMGISQINRYNLKPYGLNYETVFDPCTNLRVGSLILLDCYKRASKESSSINQSWEKAFSCYYSGNFKTGFKQDFPNQPPYVTKIVNRLIAIQNGNVKYNNNSIQNTIALPDNSFLNNENYLANSNAIKQNESANKEDVINNVNSSNNYPAVRLVNYQNNAENTQKWDVFGNSKSSNIF